MDVGIGTLQRELGGGIAYHNSRSEAKANQDIGVLGTGIKPKLQHRAIVP